MTGTALAPARDADAPAAADEPVVVALKTPFDVKAAIAPLPADLTLERAIAAMRAAIPAHDVAGHAVPTTSIANGPRAAPA